MWCFHGSVHDWSDGEPHGSNVPIVWIGAVIGFVFAIVLSSMVMP